MFAVFDFESSVTTSANGNDRDRIQVMIRKHRLDASLVKLYAADFCGTSELRQATREQVEKFVDHLARSAEQEPAALHCQLNSYAKTEKDAA